MELFLSCTGKYLLLFSFYFYSKYRVNKKKTCNNSNFCAQKKFIYFVNFWSLKDILLMLSLEARQCTGTSQCFPNRCSSEKKCPKVPESENQTQGLLGFSRACQPLSYTTLPTMLRPRLRKISLVILSSFPGSAIFYSAAILCSDGTKLEGGGEWYFLQ